MTVFIGPSIWRQINVRTMGAMLTAMLNAPDREKVIWAPIWNDALIGRSRSIMCTEFLKTDADVMVIIDDDIVFDPADLWKIIEGARETRGIYGGAYVTRSTEPHITSRSLGDGKPQLFAAGPQRRPVEYQYLATGFWAVHRDVMEAMVDAEFQDADGAHKIALCELGADRPFYPFFAPFVCIEDDGRRHYLSEDWAYCNRARQLGYKVWVDLSIILIHMGEYPYTVKDIKTLEEPGLPSTGIDVMQVDVAPRKTGDPLLDTLVEDIAEFSGDSIGDTLRGLEYGTTYLFNLWNARGEQSEEDWYKDENVGLSYILDLASWHLRGYGVPADVAPGLAGKRVLDYGAGIGTFAFRAAQAGAEVDAYDTNPILRQFIAWRASKRDIHVLVTEPVGRYDAIVCWHVFEHVEDPESLLRDLKARLRPDGMLISESGFTDQSTPMHHAHDDWNAVLERNGFVANPSTPGIWHLAEVAEAVA